MAGLTRLPGGHWLVGHAREFARDGLRFYQDCERLGGIVQSRILVKRLYVISDPAAIGEVLVEKHRHFIKPYVLRRMKVVFGNGLLTSDGETWLHNRRLVQPAFQSARIRAFAEVARGRAERLADRWAAGGECDVVPDLVDLCLGNLTEVMLGRRDAELAGLVRRLVPVTHALARTVSHPLKLPPTAWPNALGRELRAALQDIYRYIDALMAERRRTPTTDFLGLLVGGRSPGSQPLDPQVIRDEMVTLLLAGHETAAAALIWGLHLLATHPVEADALATELATRLGGAAPAVDDLDGLPRLRAVLDETLRLYPPTHRVGRSVLSPVTIGGVDLPVGSEVLLPQWAVHRSARHYDEPDAFRPARWTAAFRASLPKFAYFPFSGGPRTCVGANLVWFEDAITLAAIVQRVRFAPADAAAVVPREGLTLVPAGGRLRLRLEPRMADSVRGLEKFGVHQSQSTHEPRDLPAVADSDLFPAQHGAVAGRARCPAHVARRAGGAGAGIPARHAAELSLAGAHRRLDGGALRRGR